MRDNPLGVHTAPSGNRCVVTFRMRPVTKVTVSFTWDRRPSADDREEWSFAILAHALQRALEQAFLERAAVEALREMVTEGIFERVGVSRAGDWAYGETKAAAPLPRWVISLTAKRRERLSRVHARSQ